MTLSHDLYLPIAALHSVLLANVCTSSRLGALAAGSLHARVAGAGGAGFCPQDPLENNNHSAPPRYGGDLLKRYNGRDVEKTSGQSVATTCGGPKTLGHHL